MVIDHLENHPFWEKMYDKGDKKEDDDDEEEAWQLTQLLETGIPFLCSSGVRYAF